MNSSNKLMRIIEENSVNPIKVIISQIENREKKNLIFDEDFNDKFSMRIHEDFIVFIPSSTIRNSVILPYLVTKYSKRTILRTKQIENRNTPKQKRFIERIAAGIRIRIPRTAYVLYVILSIESVCFPPCIFSCTAYGLESIDIWSKPSYTALNKKKQILLSASSYHERNWNKREKWITAGMSTTAVTEMF